MIFESFKIKNVEFKSRLLRSSVGGRTAAYNGVVPDVWENLELFRYETARAGKWRKLD